MVVGGLGLGYTAMTALQDPRVRSLIVVDALAEVIDWHRRELLPDTRGADRRPADAAWSTATSSPWPRRSPGSTRPGRAAASTPSCWTSTTPPATCCTRPTRRSTPPDGLRRLAAHLVPGGVFALWSDDPPEPGFSAVLSEVFPGSRAEVVAFPNPLTGGESANTVYLGRAEHG